MIDAEEFQLLSEARFIQISMGIDVCVSVQYGTGQKTNSAKL